MSMDLKIYTSLVVVTLYLWASILILPQHWVRGEPQVPCFFILGDSLVDSGNNNNLLTLARANYPPQGIDFPRGPTGRFCNGRTMSDFIAEHLGFNDYIQSFTSSHDSDVLLGVNYASAAAGIRSETGQHLGDRIALDRQLENHRTTVSRIGKILGNNDSAITHVQKCLYYVGFGSNDYLNNYFLPELYPTSNQYTLDQFAQVLIQQYRQQIMTLYNYGARKIALFNVGPVGCSPNELTRYHSNGSSCIEKINVGVQIFNDKLKSLVKDLNGNSSLTGANFIYVNIYDMAMVEIEAPPSTGFRVRNKACCGVGENNGRITCIPLQIPCENRTDHFFWDAYHPTEAVNEIAAARSYKANLSSDVYPVDIYRLALL